MSRMKPSDVAFAIMVVLLFDVIWQITKLIVIAAWSLAIFFVAVVYETFGDDIWELWISFVAVIITALYVLFEGTKSRLKVLYTTHLR